MKKLALSFAAIVAALAITTTAVAGSPKTADPGCLKDLNGCIVYCPDGVCGPLGP